MVTRAEWYQRVNAAWPEDVSIPTAEEAVRAVRKLYRFVKGHKLGLPIQITSGNRYTYAHGGMLYVNPNCRGRGWRELVHDLSHWLHQETGDKPHAKSHARLELRLAKEVVKRGWLAGTLKTPEKPEQAGPDPKVLRHQRILRRMELWLAKKRRAERALTKLTRQARYYERAAAAG